ncbi:complement factor H-like [Echeneis naucrates]|uniref:complement factor H-like n=1 Tax=Echeneis naucrates TaxID=173247 RepID=UPI00111404AA|nr:complement factor H-like [Echeneis naucrates]
MADIVNYKEVYGYHEQANYVCKDGYEGRFYFTCGEDGWIGNPQCRECPKPKVPHGFIIGPYNETLYFTCEDGYKLASKNWWGEATCTDGVWSGLEQCIEKNKCGELPVIPNRKETFGRISYEEDERVPVICKEGYVAVLKHLRCLRGKWHSNGTALKAICEPTANHCSAPSKVENAIAVTSPQREYLSGSEVTYRCRENYTMLGDATITCNNGKWEDKNITCTALWDTSEDLP